MRHIDDASHSGGTYAGMGSWANEANPLLAEIWRALGPATVADTERAHEDLPATGIDFGIEAGIDSGAAPHLPAAATPLSLHSPPPPPANGSLGACYCYCARGQGIGRCFDKVTEAQCHSGRMIFSKGIDRYVRYVSTMTMVVGNTNPLTFA